MSDVPAGYQRVAALSDVPPGRCVAAMLGEESIVLTRIGDRVHALENRCPHAGAPLSEGFLEGELITCSWHGWTFDARTGGCVDDPELVVPSYRVLIVGDDVYVSRDPSLEAAPGGAA